MGKIIKLIVLRIISILYLFGAMFVLGLAMLGPFMMSEGSTPLWVYLVIYPLALILAGSQEICLTYLENKLKEYE